MARVVAVETVHSTGVVEAPDEVAAEVAPGRVKAAHRGESVTDARLALTGGIGQHGKRAQLDVLAGLVEDVSRSHAARPGGRGGALGRPEALGRGHWRRGGGGGRRLASEVTEQVHPSGNEVGEAEIESSEDGLLLRLRLGVAAGVGSPGPAGPKGRGQSLIHTVRLKRVKG